ncbi:threonine synthase [Treponema endosymbiont of Eucomonympha sp.]|uniref:threonine synthase n=1 Tax=Treponema endosymbiont of Eucomonympha sp. TaxID=1580831 RepID=UPI0007519110|nr:threonine synthase [Treponema endosymbiont of Eucomonympha sp.]
MTYTDTRNPSVKTDFASAVTLGMNAATGGLYIPCSYPRLPDSLLSGASVPPFFDVALETAKLYAGDEIPPRNLKAIIADAYPFDAPLVRLADETSVLELFHGPTCAFKDFGARFMARVMSYFNRNADRRLHILVATSGDTGSAVGSAFYQVPGLDVTILYPAGKISPLQEKQLSTFDGNIRALKVSGTFDDCQKLVKTAFTDDALRAALRLSSANSINISRLLPQSFYYIHSSLALRAALAEEDRVDDVVIMVVPSGNFGNLTSGLIAREMGAPIDGFVAATNANKTVPDWLASGNYEPRPSVPTLSNAMDVGAPSNYERIAAMYSLEQARRLCAACWLDDAGTLEAIRECGERSGYLLDPHGAVAWQAWSDLRPQAGSDARVRRGTITNIPEWHDKLAGRKANGVILETAHPAKFSETVQKACGRNAPLPERLAKVLALPERATQMPNDYAQFREWLRDNLD